MPTFPIRIYTENQYQLIENQSDFEKILQKFTYIRAAGGWVINKNGEVLMIFRRGKWDLPKGKVENGELDEQAALREVWEETGIKAEIIDNQFISVWHTYEMNGLQMLKETRWFRMTATTDQHLKPQTEEDIEFTGWEPLKTALQKLESSYPSLNYLATQIHSHL